MALICRSFKLVKSQVGMGAPVTAHSLGVVPTNLI